MPTNSVLRLFLLFHTTVFLLFLFSVRWKGLAKGGPLEQEYLLKIFKVAEQEKKAGKRGSESALCKENAWTAWGVECGREVSRLKNESVPYTIHKN